MHDDSANVKMMRERMSIRCEDVCYPQEMRIWVCYDDVNEQTCSLCVTVGMYFLTYTEMDKKGKTLKCRHIQSIHKEKERQIKPIELLTRRKRFIELCWIKELFTQLEKIWVRERDKVDDNRERVNLSIMSSVGGDVDHIIHHEISTTVFTVLRRKR